ncbi:hypothetical protein EJ03DRAFT_350127 [Teratosphaeria nubilosa]|uniref:Uncharacterized protein n=1 Tax=Teratosphaeria nubilosa TaxID=161662 RepID=A0A6G1LE19_9PEZI|nr:hypothetical protein EJ03DRAFT_350127 [Teratosphaeria nubilosa]
MLTVSSLHLVTISANSFLGTQRRRTDGRSFQDESFAASSPYWDAPFIAPPPFDTKYIRDLLQRACDLMKDEFQALQTDCRYFHNSLANLHAFKYTQTLGPAEQNQRLTDTLLRVSWRLDDLIITLGQAVISIDILGAAYIADITTRSSDEEGRLGDLLVLLLEEFALLDQAKSLVTYHRPSPGDMTNEELFTAVVRFGLNAVPRCVREERFAVPESREGARYPG